MAHDRRDRMCVRVRTDRCGYTVRRGRAVSWNHRDAKKSITEFVDRVTTHTPDFVPETERVAVFEHNDGTLWIEAPWRCRRRVVGLGDALRCVGSKQLKRDALSTGTHRWCKLATLLASASKAMSRCCDSVFRSGETV